MGVLAVGLICFVSFIPKKFVSFSFVNIQFVSWLFQTKCLSFGKFFAMHVTQITTPNLKSREVHVVRNTQYSYIRLPRDHCESLAISY